MMIMELPTPKDVEFRREMARLRSENEALIGAFMEADPIVSNVWWVLNVKSAFSSRNSQMWCPWRVFSSRDDAVAYVREQVGLEV